MTSRGVPGILGGVGLALVSAGGCDGSPCSPKTQDELGIAATECGTIEIAGTELTHLDGLGTLSADRPVWLDIYSNAQLTDILGATGAESIHLSRNPGVRTIDVAVRRSFTAQFSELDVVALALGPTPIDSPVSVHFASTASTARLTLSCSEPNACPNAGLALETDWAGRTIEVRPGFTLDRLAASPVTDWTSLQGAGVPTSRVTVRVDGDDAPAREYQAWLRSEGFTGTFESCQVDSDVCEELTTE